MKEVLRFDDVSMHYHSKQGETVALSEGEFVAIIGPLGRGKTTLLSLAAGLLKPTSGVIHHAGGSFGYMLQKDELFPWRTIEKNIFLPLEIKRKDTQENRERAVALAEKYGLKQFLKSFLFQNHFCKIDLIFNCFHESVGYYDIWNNLFNLFLKFFVLVINH